MSPSPLIRSIVLALLACATVGAVVVATARAQETRPETPPPAATVQDIEFCAELPAIGNVDLVKKWRFGRIHRLAAQGNEILLDLRCEEGVIVSAICPRGPFAELAQASRWMDNRSNPFPGIRDYVERQVAFDIDETGRIIALASLEPIPREGRRIARAMTR